MKEKQKDPDAVQTDQKPGQDHKRKQDRKQAAVPQNQPAAGAGYSSFREGQDKYQKRNQKKNQEYTNDGYGGSRCFQTGYLGDGRNANFLFPTIYVVWKNKMCYTVINCTDRGNEQMETKLWREVLTPYELAVRELTVKFQHLMKEYRDRGMYSPIEEVSGRVKSISSILMKAQKKGIALENIEKEMYDIAGVRIICQFVEDIDMVADLIRKRADMKVLDVRDYVHNIKDSGYRSYHMIISYEVETLNGSKTICAEIQIRTLGMNFWAIIEHSLQYKYPKNMPDHIRQKLLKAAQAIVVLDSQLSAVRGEIMDAQNSFQIQNNMISEILNNIQNLYQHANKREIVKIQDEFYRIYESNDLEKLQRFEKELDVIAEGYRAQALEYEKDER
mgnify:FL=1